MPENVETPQVTVKTVLYSAEYFQGPRYLEAKAKVMAYMMKSAFWMTKNGIREGTGFHAYIVDRALDDFLVEGRIGRIVTEHGFMWKWREV